MRSGFVELADGSALHYYDASPEASHLFPIVYHHGSPNVGEPPEPLIEPAAARGLRWIGYDAVDLGPLSESWRVERDTPAYVTRATAEELRELTASAKRVQQA